MKYLLILFFCFSIFSQSNETKIEILYSHTLLFKGNAKYAINSRLLLGNKQSLYEIDHTGKLGLRKINEDMGLNEVFSDNNNINVPAEDNEFVFKDFENNSITYMELITFKKLFITDSIHNFKWEVTNINKNILGYNCKRAITSFRGRNYEAFFTEEIPITNGPWHFHGLPGLILEVNVIDSDDLDFSMKAYGIREIGKNKFSISNPYEKEKVLNWHKFLDLYKKKYDEILRNNMTSNGPSSTIPKKSIMVYIED